MWGPSTRLPMRTYGAATTRRSSRSSASCRMGRGSGQAAVHIVSAELTEPYAVPLADDLVDGVLAEAIRDTAAKAEDGPVAVF